MNIIKILYASLIGSLALIMMGSLWANDNRPTERSTKVNIQGYIFELYPPNTQAQIDIIEALYNMLRYKRNYCTEAGTGKIDRNDYYNQYRKALKSVGHYSVLLWRNALNAPVQIEDKYGSYDTTLFFDPFGTDTFKRLNYLLDEAIKEGKGNISYQEFFNTLESFYITANDYRNSMLEEMIQERNHVRALA